MTMPQTSVRDRLLAVFRDEVNVDLSGVSPSALFSELGIDSLALLGLANALENEFNVSITSEDLETFQSLDSVMTLVESRSRHDAN